MLSGGEIIDEGLYGCVFTPPLECKKKLSLNPDLTYTKITSKESAKTELNISKKISQIPLWRNYFIVSESMCEPASISEQKDKNLHKCQLLSDTKQLSQFRLLSMPYGGNPLYTYRFNITQFNFMEFIQHFIESVALLNLFGIVHRDLHQKNILVDRNDVPRIIDFNLSIFVNNDITSNMLKHQFTYKIDQEPPDSTLVNAVLFNYPADNVIESLIFKKPIIKKISNILHISQNEMYQELENFFNKSMSMRTGNDVKWFKTYWRTIDSWAVGVIILDLINKLSIYPTFNLILRKLKPKLYPLLRKLCAISPVNRIDCVQALNYLNPNSFIIRKYAKSWLDKVGPGNISY